MSKRSVNVILGVEITAAALIFTAFVLFSGDISTTFSNQSLTLSTKLVGNTVINYSDITSVDLKDNLDIGKRTFGVGSMRLQAGSFKNDEFGSYKLYSYSSVKTYIIVKCTGGIVVFNQKDTALTKQAYDLLMQRVSDKGK